MPQRVALSFLGTGRYEPTEYQWNGATCTTKFMPVALNELFAPDTLLVAETPGAQAKHGDELATACDYTSVEVPHATAEADWWRLFNAMADAVPEDTTLVVDITHGFRSQPLLALAVVLYLRVVKDVDIERIVYGAYEAGDGGTSPVVDLTAFLRIIDWAVATEQFKAYGDARPLRTMFREIADETRSSPRMALNLRPAGEALHRVTRALSLNRPIETLTEAEDLVELLEKAMGDVRSVPQAQPLKRLMLVLARRFAPLGHADGSVFAQRGFAAQGAMLRFYVETEQYLQGFTLAQEMLVSWVCIREGYDPLTQGSGGEERAQYNGRKGARALLFDWSDARNSNADLWTDLPDKYQQAVTLWNALREYRNDVAHAGFSHNPTPAQKLIDEAEDVLYAVADFMTPDRT